MGRYVLIKYTFVYTRVLHPQLGRDFTLQLQLSELAVHIIRGNEKFPKPFLVFRHLTERRRILVAIRKVFTSFSIDAVRVDT